jgi:hypothetical protein
MVVKSKIKTKNELGICRSITEVLNLGSKHSVHPPKLIFPLMIRKHQLTGKLFKYYTISVCLLKLYSTKPVENLKFIKRKPIYIFSLHIRIL